MVSTQRNFKIVSGSFLDGIACDVPSNNWGAKKWQKQFDTMKKMGMDTVIIIRVGWKDSAMYNSNVMQPTIYYEEDLVELMFREADRTELRLYLGLFDTENYWPKNDWDAEVAINKKLIEEMWERYKMHKCFYGWYLSHEGGIEYHMPKIWKPITKKIRGYDPSKKILISPRYGGEKWYASRPISPEQHYKHFDYIFNEMDGLIDEAAFMDGHTSFKNLKGFVEVTNRVCRKYKVAFWSNLETFDRDMPFKFPPIEWIKMEFKLEVVQPYVEKIITFEAPHFLSPYSMYPSARELYFRYLEYIAERGVKLQEKKRLAEFANKVG